MSVFLGKPPAGIEAWIKAHIGPEPGPTAPDGKVLYRTTAGGEWLQNDADITDGVFSGFENKENAVEVIIPSKDASGNDVTGIEYEAFSACGGLTSVTIPDSVTIIQGNAFYYCSGLTNIVIGSGVTSIEPHALSDCSSLASVTFNSFTKDEVKSLTTDDHIFGWGYGLSQNPIEKSFTAICTDGSMTVHFSADYPATITFTDL